MKSNVVRPPYIDNPSTALDARLSGRTYPNEIRIGRKLTYVARSAGTFGTMRAEVEVDFVAFTTPAFRMLSQIRMRIQCGMNLA